MKLVMRNVAPILLFVIILLMQAGCGAEPDQPDAYPNRPIKVIVPFSPGGETDTFARIMKKGIEDNKLLPVPLVILNRDGAGATVGSRSVKNARPDGYTVLCLHNALFTAKYAGTVNYGPEAFEPVAGTGEFGMVVAVAESSQYKDLTALMDQAKRQPKSILFGVNRGTPSHFAALMLEQAAPGAQFRFTQSGSGVHRYGDVVGGHVEVSAFSIGEYVRFDKIRALAYFGEERHPGAKHLPTAKEQGFDLTTSNMQFWWFPKGTKKAKVDYLAGVFEQAMQTKYVRKKLAGIHCEPEFVKGAALHERIAAYTERLEKISLRPTIALPNVPLLVLGTIVVLLGLLAVQQIRRHRKPIFDVNAPGPAFGRVGIAMALTVTYVGVLWAEWLPFPATTAVFVTALGVVMSRGNWRIMPFVLLTAVGLGYGLYYVFTRVFVIDLP